MSPPKSTRPHVDPDVEKTGDNLAVPRSVLLRHGLRTLDPTTAVVAPGRPKPRSTIYRANALLIPEAMLRDKTLLKVIGKVLRAMDLKMVRPRKVELVSDDGPARQRAVELAVRRGGKPTVVDAWVALQHLHADGGLGDLVNGIRLEHAFVAGRSSSAAVVRSRAATPRRSSARTCGWTAAARYRCRCRWPCHRAGAR